MENSMYVTFIVRYTDGFVNRNYLLFKLLLLPFLLRSPAIDGGTWHVCPAYSCKTHPRRPRGY